jgi:hypothetical protein
VRVTPPTWERVRQLALSDRLSVQELLYMSLSREFERRGLPPLQAARTAQGLLKELIHRFELEL